MTKNVLQHLPTWVSRWLGYRPPHPPALPPPSNSPTTFGSLPPKPLPQHCVWIWTWIGAFGGISVIQAVFGQANYFVNRGVTPIVPSYGATAVLIYGVIDSPLAQPRAVIFGHFIGALVGVGIAKLFGHLPTEERFDELAWLAASLACATTIVLMQMTKTVHPPAGATAFIPILDNKQRALGWYFLPVILLSSVLALAVALLVNNIQRRYPLWWLEPPALGLPAPKPSMTDNRRSGDNTSEKKLISVVSSTTPVTGTSTLEEDTTGRTSPSNAEITLLQR